MKKFNFLKAMRTAPRKKKDPSEKICVPFMCKLTPVESQFIEDLARENCVSKNSIMRRALRLLIKQQQKE